MQQKIETVLNEMLKEITPTDYDRRKIGTLAKKLEQNVARAAAKKKVEAIIRVEGSVAKDTWIRKEPDIDVFMCLSPTIPRKELGEISLQIAREATKGSQQVERFAEHPYLEAVVDNVRVNIVPCYCTKQGEWLSATDRTPFHTDYIKKHLNKTLRNEIRLLKKFMQGIGVYGAEIKIGGFSGYLCELLILHYRSFVETLSTIAGCTQRLFLDIEDYYAHRENEPKLLFPEPLVVIDPVDKGRNVASAVRAQKIYTFVAAARAFLKNPSREFFDPPKTQPLPIAKLKQKLRQRGSAHIFLVLSPTPAVPDVLWGQLYRTQRSLRKLFELNDFKVLRDAVWSDEKTLSAFILELEQSTLPIVRKHVGPPLERQLECEDFLAKYVGNGNVVAGPYIEDARWNVELCRKFTDAVDFLKEKLKDGGKNAGVAGLVSQALRKELNVKVNDEITKIYANNKEFAGFLTDFVDGKPFWLKTPEG